MISTGDQRDVAQYIAQPWLMTYVNARTISTAHDDNATLLLTHLQCGWLGSRVVSVLDSGAEGPGFKSQPRRCRVTVLGKLFTPMCLCSLSSETGSSPLKGCGSNHRPGGK